MHTTWIFVTDGALARSFACNGRVDRDPWVSLMTFEHASSRARARDLVSDRPGHTFKSSGGVFGAMLSRVDSLRDLEKRRFAEALGATLDEHEREGAFDDLVIVAPPRFLGMLRAALAPAVARRVVATVPHDLTWMRDAALRSRLADQVGAIVSGARLARGGAWSAAGRERSLG